MLKFAIKEEYTLTPEIYGHELGFDVAQLRRVEFANFMAIGNKRLVIHFRAQPFNRDDLTDEGLICELGGSNFIPRNMSKALNSGQRERPHAFQAWRSCRLNGSLLFTGPADKAQLFSDYGKDDSLDISIKNPLQDTRDDWGNSLRFRQNEFQTSIGEGSLIPIPIKFNGKTNRIGILNVDLGNQKAKWITNLPPQSVSLKGKVSRIWRRPKSNANADPLIKISADALFPGSKFDMVVTHSMLRGGELYIFTRGVHEATYVRGGHQFSAIAHIGVDGKVISFPFIQNHLAHNDQKKRGHFASFTSSRKYCILKSIYKPADDWKGKQRLFDMDSHDLIELKLPRGYSSYQLVDHNDLDFWFQKPLTPGHQMETKIIRCEVI
ncbi:MAG: hypothetical protein ABJN69_07795 [Hellea sp.]